MIFSLMRYLQSPTPHLGQTLDESSSHSRLHRLAGPMITGRSGVIILTYKLH